MVRLSINVTAEDPDLALDGPVGTPGAVGRRVQVGAERMLVVTGFGTKRLLVQRGVDGTAATPHDVGATVTCIIPPVGTVLIEGESWQAPGAASHPDVAAHDTLGLTTQAEMDAHRDALDPHSQYALDTDLTTHEADTTSVHGIADTATLLTTAHTAAADPHTQYQRESEKGQPNGYASLDASGLVPDAQIPASIARDSEVPDLGGHVAAADPHVGYVREADANWTDLTDGGQTSLHSHAGGPGGEAFPVGAVFLSVVATDPATLLGYGTWAAIGAGRMLMGWNTGDTLEATGGSSTHTHADHTGVLNHTHPVTDPGHTHLTQRYPTATGSSSGFTIDTSMSGTLADNTLPTKATTTGVTTSNPAGGVSALTHDSPSHVPPYLIVRMWKRTA